MQDKKQNLPRSELIKLDDGRQFYQFSSWARVTTRFLPDDGEGMVIKAFKVAVMTFHLLVRG